MAKSTAKGVTRLGPSKKPGVFGLSQSAQRGKARKQLKLGPKKTGSFGLTAGGNRKTSRGQLPNLGPRRSARGK